MTGLRAVAIRVVLFAAVTAVLLVFIVQTIQNPVAGKTDSYRADFTDANGLKAGDDVRIFGVQVGEVSSVDLHGGLARVGFSVRREHPLRTTTRIAVKYQSLTGQRFLDVEQDKAAGPVLRPGTTIGTDRTIPAFDITTLFNGLQPVLADFSTAQVNQFTSTMLAVIQGDGAGVGPALDAIEKFSGYVTDRQNVLSTLIANFRVISDHLGGRSDQLTELITQLTAIFTGLQQHIDGLIDFTVTSPPLLEPIDRLAATIGLTERRNDDLDDVLHRIFPDPKALADLLSRLPGLVQSLNAAIPDAKTGVRLSCSAGNEAAPPQLRPLLDGQGVTLCRPSKR